MDAGSVAVHDVLAYQEAQDAMLKKHIRVTYVIRAGIISILHAKNADAGLFVFLIHV